MADKNIQFKQTNGEGFDFLFPKTKVELVLMA